MTEFVLTPAVVDVVPAEYLRLLGYPRDASLSDRALELAAWARAWYRDFGRPWAYARLAEAVSIAEGAVAIEDAVFTSSRLRTALQVANAHAVALVAASAGPEAEAEAHRLWIEGKPDEYFFLEMFASAVVEHLVAAAGARLWTWAGEHSMNVLPHASPGYSQWDVAEQVSLLRLIRRQASVALPGRLETLDSGALVPKKSQLAVFGLTRCADHAARLADLVPCRQCDLPHCDFRRVPPPLPYSTNPKALRRWAAERLVLLPQPDGGIHARFRYDGVTCTNMGRPLAFDYQVTLGPRDEGYPIREQSCAPAPDDSGYTCMCKYLIDGPGLMAAIAREKPLAGRPLAEVLAWQRTGPAAGCYCEESSREHKWGLVLETIHYALHHPEPR